ncbi:MAG: DUF3060 domain-containing protein [Parasphingorhabdus sp.]
MINERRKVAAISWGVIMLALWMPSATLAAAEDIHIRSVAEDRTLDCNNQSDAVISGSSNNVTVRNCRSVTITGASNDIDIFGTPMVRVSGASNNVTVTFDIEGSIHVSGGSNDVDVIEKQGSKTRVHDRGLRNNISRGVAE